MTSRLLERSVGMTMPLSSSVPAGIVPSWTGVSYSEGCAVRVSVGNCVLGLTVATRLHEVPLSVLR